MVYYNEIERYVAQWLRNLIDSGEIANGIVDERSIEDVHPRDLDGFSQCHFFAGIGGWSYALRRAGWADDRPVWTGSCPCQPFSAAGKGGGFADERHMWPSWHHLIQECGPAIVFGEQVASGAAVEWLDLVQDDVEGLGYAFGAVPFPAAGLGAPHIRDRLYWVADLHSAGFGARGEGLQAVGYGSPAGADRGAGPHGSAGPLHGHWADADWLFCRDDKWRPVEPGTFPLADGLPARVGRLRGYGNAIVPQAAQKFIAAYMAA